MKIQTITDFPTLGELFARVGMRSTEFSRAPLFAYMRDATVPAETRLSYVPYMVHFVMTFADLYAYVLREEPARDRFQELVNIHSYEDGGRWKWFLADLRNMGFDPMLRFSDAIRFIWSDATRCQRILSYQICRLGFRADSMQKLVLAQCIEATGKVALQATARVEQELRAKVSYKSIYFGNHHFETESSHTIEDEDVMRDICTTRISIQDLKYLQAMVDESFGYFRDFTDEALAFARKGLSIAA
jgi:hypothetical protein